MTQISCVELEVSGTHVIISFQLGLLPHSPFLLGFLFTEKEKAQVKASAVPRSPMPATQRSLPIP